MMPKQLEAQDHEQQGRGQEDVIGLKPRLCKALQDWLKNAEIIYRVASGCKGPAHIVFPQLMARNIQDMRDTLEDCGLQYRIYFAHKPTKSHVFVRQALKEGIGLDVASEKELVSALSAGFRGEQIECTGVKNNAFLELALRHRCVIVLDSKQELQRICALKDSMGLKDTTNVLVRITDVSFADRQHKSRHSRFGNTQRSLPEIFEVFHDRADIEFIGYHLHNDERESDIRAAQVEDILSLMEAAYEEGFEPTLLNIGGGLRRQMLDHYDDWAVFVNALEEALMDQHPQITWERYSYGMRLNDKGKIMGRGAVQGLIPAGDFSKVLTEIFTSDRQRGRELGKIIVENGFDVVVEPGHALLDQCGISLFEVVEVKENRDGENMVLVDANMYNLAVPMREYLFDPLLIPRPEQDNKEKPANDEGFEGFIIGNLCREEDFLTKRKISFGRKPQAGDLIAFTNTAAYKMDFEDASPHLHTTGTKIVAYRKQGVWQHCQEDAYNPYDAGEIDL